MNSGMGRVYDITFRDCTFTSNTGAGSGDGVNGVKIWSSGQGQHYLTFAGCTFQVLSRMGIEVCGNNSDSNPTLYNIALRNCTFEPTTLGEPISLFDLVSLRHQPADHLAGRRLHDQGLRQRGKRHLRWGHRVQRQPRRRDPRRADLVGPRAPAFNFGRQSGGAGGIHVKTTSVDFTHTCQTRPAGMFSHITNAANIDNSLWQDCTFNTGNAANQISCAITGCVCMGGRR